MNTLKSIASKVAATSTETVKQTRQAQSDRADSPSPPDADYQGIRDRWETFKDRGQSLLNSGRQSLDNLRHNGERLAQALSGGAHPEASEAMAEFTNWLQPTNDAIRAVVGARQEVDDKVHQALAQADPELIQQTADRAATSFGDFVTRIYEAKTDASQRVLDAGATVQSHKNQAFNGVAEALSQAFVDNEDQLETLGSTLHKTADFFPQFDENDSLASLILPAPIQAYTTAIMAVDTMGELASESPKIADDFLRTPWLPTEDNFDQWLQKFEPGQSFQNNRGFGLSIAAGLGGDVEQNQQWTVSRSQSDPNRYSLTIASDSMAALKLGKELQDQGLAIGAGGGSAKSIRFDFDISKPGERELMADLTLSNQLGIPNKALVSAAEKHLVSVTNMVRGGADAGTDIVGIDLSTQQQILHQSTRRGDTVVDRFTYELSGGVSLGNSFGRIPDSIFAPMTARAADADLVGNALTALSGGHIGTESDAKIALSAGLEVEDQQVARLIAGASIDGQALGHQGRVDLEFVVHNPQQLAAALGRTPNELATALRAGDVDIQALTDAAATAGLVVEDTFGLTLTATAEAVDGAELDVANIHYGRTLHRENTRELATFGTPIDYERPSLDDDEATMRLLDRSFAG